MKPINKDQLFSAGYLSLSVTSLSFGSHCRNISAGKRKLTTRRSNLVKPGLPGFK
ncbi:MAG: hypothetical protein JWQ09_840 [Segetibacter sp.]|nr:hypothetical protein [Segetibacter sp.]